MNLFLVPYLGFAVKYNVTDNHVFFLIPYLIMVIFMAEGLKSMFSRWGKRSLIIAVCCTVMSFPMYLLASKLAVRIPQLAQLDKQKAYKGGIAYFLNPVHRIYAEDPLKIAKESIVEGKRPVHADEWHYDVAVAYVRKTNEAEFSDDPEKN